MAKMYVSFFASCSTIIMWPQKRRAYENALPDADDRQSGHRRWQLGNVSVSKSQRKRSSIDREMFHCASCSVLLTEFG